MFFEQQKKLGQELVSRKIEFSPTSFLARQYESTGRAIAVTTSSALASVLLKMLKFLV